MTVGTMEELAKDMGIDPSKISVHYNNYVLRMMQRGVIVDLDIGWIRGQARVSEEELGITMSKEEKDYVSLGHQKILPPELIKEAEREEGRGRAALEKHTVQLVLGRFLPVTASESFLEADAEHKANFLGVRDKIVAGYDPMVHQLRDDFKARADAVWERLETKPQQVKRIWVAEYAENLVRRIPGKDAIQKSFYWNTKFSFMPLPSSIQEEMARQKKIAQEQELLHYETEDRKRQIEGLNARVLEQMNAQKEEALKQAGSFLDETVLSLRKVMVDTCAKALETINRNDGKMLGSTVKSIDNLVKRVRMLNFYNDEEVAKLNDELAKQIEKTPKNRSVRTMKDIMKRIDLALGKSVRAVQTDREKQQEVTRIIGKDFMAMAREVE